ncbi:MAG TPA: riboflavin synthase [Acidimicrobiia bacterium]|nr:riboflavin synthase [Acidimicrobiia bacterium]
MFTGIIESLGTVREVAGTDQGRRLVVEADLAPELEAGDSISVNGVCLTVTDQVDSSFGLDVVTETLRRTNLGSLLVGDRVNLERPVRVDGRLDGHVVQGHVDTFGAVSSITPEGVGRRVAIDVSPRYRRYLVEKGSIAVDGVALTIAAVTDTGFEAALIPFTLQVTNLGLRQAGQQVNLEFDVLAKYLERLMQARDGAL